MPKQRPTEKPSAKKPTDASAAPASPGKPAVSAPALSQSKGSNRPSSLLETRVIYCGLRRAQSSRDNLEQLAKLPDAWLQRAKSSYFDLIYIDPPAVSKVEPPFNSNRNYEVFWGETKEKRAFEDRHASTQAYSEENGTALSEENGTE
jgi:hypothetical protein